MKIPLHLKLKKKAHQDIAYAQDLIVEELYSFFPKAVLHGGTAIWRCYQGNRFSEDIDVYLTKKNQINDFFQNLEKKGFQILKKRIKENSLYSLLEYQRTQIQFEALFKKPKNFILKHYENIDGNLTSIYTLHSQDLIQEKIAACLKRKKIRDLYDIFFLLRHLKDKNIPNLKKLKNIKTEDEKNLKTLIISGLVPSPKEMLEYIGQWAK